MSAQVPIFAKDALAQGKPLEGPRSRAGVHGVVGDPRISPHKPRKERRGKGGPRRRKGMQPGSPRKASGNFPRAKGPPHPRAYNLAIC
jgi:hypothetical protein